MINFIVELVVFANVLLYCAEFIRNSNIVIVDQNYYEEGESLYIV